MPGLIEEIRVEGLFGRYDYSISLGNDADKNAPHISLLYGDNGTGKTTILNLVFHLLSSSTGRGHKSRIARIPFQYFSVVFSDQTMVWASRTANQLTGNFELGLRLEDGYQNTAAVEADPISGGVLASTASPELRSLFVKISKAVPDLFYMRDDRTLESDTLPTREGRVIRSRAMSDTAEGELYYVDYDLNDQRENVLKESIERTQKQLYIELARASTRGEADARQIYADVLRTIAIASTSTEDFASEKSRLNAELRELEKISQMFAEVDLGSPLDASPLVDTLLSADESTLPVVAQVLRSFLDGQKARLNALEVLYEKMHNFVSTTNEYLIDKSVELDVSKGLTIRIPNGELDPSVLSSGEQHLLLLFLNVFTSSDQSRTFIIDEPEMSLNIKWQRELVDSLLSLTQNTLCQFLLATHSIELLAKNRRFVTHLRP